MKTMKILVLGLGWGLISTYGCGKDPEVKEEQESQSAQVGYAAGTITEGLEVTSPEPDLIQEEESQCTKWEQSTGELNANIKVTSSQSCEVAESKAKSLSAEKADTLHRECRGAIDKPIEPSEHQLRPVWGNQHLGQCEKTQSDGKTLFSFTVRKFALCCRAIHSNLTQVYEDKFKDTNPNQCGWGQTDVKDLRYPSVKLPSVNIDNQTKSNYDLLMTDKGNDCKNSGGVPYWKPVTVKKGTINGVDVDLYSRKGVCCGVRKFTTEMMGSVVAPPTSVMVSEVQVAPPTTAIVGNTVPQQPATETPVAAPGMPEGPPAYTPDSYKDTQTIYNENPDAYHTGAATTDY